jgi:hypothetical protein
VVVLVAGVLGGALAWGVGACGEDRESGVEIEGSTTGTTSTGPVRTTTTP